MPEIPLISPGTRLVDTGVQVARTAQLRAGDAGMAWGKALQGIGQDVSNIAVKMQKAKDVKNLSDLSIQMSNAQVEFAKFQSTNPDESTWLPKWEETMKGIQQQAEQTPLSEEARNRFSENFTNWSGRGTIAIQGQAVEQSVSNAKLSFKTALDMGQRTKQWGPAVESIKNLRDSGLVPEEQIAAMEEDLKSTQQITNTQEYDNAWSSAQKQGDGVAMMDWTESAYQNNLIDKNQYEERMFVAGQTRDLKTFEDIAVGDPYSAMEQLKAGNFNGLTTENKRYAEQLAEGIASDYKRRERSKIADLLASGVSLDKYQFQWVRSPAEQQEIKAAASSRLMTVDEAAATRLALEAEIGKYSPDADKDRMQMIRISSALDAYKKAVPQASEDLVSMWNDRRSGKPGTRAEIAAADNAKYLSDLYKPRLEALMTGTGADKKIKPGKEGEYRRLLAEQSELQIKYKEMLPADPTAEQAVKTSGDVLTVPATRDAVNWFENSDGLPQGGAGLDDSNPLLPTTTW